MKTEPINLERSDVHKLLSTANADAALLYIYLKAGNPIADAEGTLRLSQSRLNCAAATLRQMGLWMEEKPAHVFVGERPSYTEQDVILAQNSQMEFRGLCDEVQRLLGRPIHTEDRKILLGFVNYLGLPADVVSVLISYCKERDRQRGKVRVPTLYSIEKEAYAWAERGIDTVEEAAAFIQNQNIRNTRMNRLLALLQIRGRNLTAAEERYASAWLEMNFEESSRLRSGCPLPRFPKKRLPALSSLPTSRTTTTPRTSASPTTSTKLWPSSVPAFGIPATMPTGTPI